MDVTAAMVKSLRDKTGLSMGDCKKALVEAGGDENKAVDVLRKMGLGRIEKAADREAGQGRVVCHVEGNRAGIAEVRCESAPVSNTDDFIALSQAVAKAAASLDNPTPESVLAATVGGRKVSDQLHEVFNRLREKIVIQKVACLKGEVGSYTHHNGQVGVVIELNGACPNEIKADVCMQIAAMRPRVTRREEVPADEIAREKAASLEEIKGKPPQIAEKIVTGKLERWFSEFVLLEQPFVKDDKHSVGAMLNNVSKGLTVNRFVRYQVGVA